MRTRRTVRGAAVALAIAVLGVLALEGVATANDTPPPPPAPPVTGQGNIKACELAYTQVRAEIISEFRGKVQAALDAAGNVTDLAAVAAAVTQLSSDLSDLRGALVECLQAVTPGPRLSPMAAKPRHRGGRRGGGGSTCLGTFDNAVRKATRAEDRSFRKKHHTVSPEVAAATFNAAVSTAAQNLQGCVLAAT